MRRLWVGLVVLGVSGCVDQSVPPQRLVKDQRNERERIETIRKKQLDEIDGEAAEKAKPSDSEGTGE